MPMLGSQPLIPYMDFTRLGLEWVYSGDKYKPSEKDIELIGVESPVLWWATYSGIDNSTNHTGSAGCSVVTFDYSSRADSAQIRLINSSGATQVLVASAIKALPVTRRSGKQGFLHDSFVDYDDIYQCGESKFEFGNNYVASGWQVQTLADYWWKYLSKVRNIYNITLPGARYDFEPGEWYTLQVGGAGEREYINSVCECYGMTTQVSAGAGSFTSVAFREIYQNWVADSGAVARYLATGDPRQKPVNYRQIVIGAPEYTGVADDYCEATSAQTVIQEAIQKMAGIGGGIVQLTEGTFKTTAAIDMSYNNVTLRGSGWETVIEKNCNAWGIRVDGTVATTIDNVTLSNFKITRNAADTNNVGLIYGNYAKELTIDTVWAHNGKNHTVALYYCNDLLLTRSKSSQAALGGFYLHNLAIVPMSARISNCLATSAAISGFSLDGVAHGSIVGCQAYDNGCAGIYMSYSVYNTITGNVTRHNNTENGIGEQGGLIVVASCVGNVISGNIVTDNLRRGIYVYTVSCSRNVFTGNRATNNTANFTDVGTQTTNIGNDWA